MTAADLLEVLWRDFVALAPQAEEVRYLLAGCGEIVRNDRLTLRTFGAPGVGIDALARPFAQRGWRPRDHYHLRDRHLRACLWQHDDAALPEIVVSEVAVEELSCDARSVIGALVGQLPARFGERDDAPSAGRPWLVSDAQYRVLLAECEHAAWVAAFGMRVHHVAIDVGALSTFPDLAALAAFLVEHGFQLDQRGAVRGSPGQRIACAATRPDRVTVAFSDATVAIPGGRYELTQRDGMPGEPRHGPHGGATLVMGTT